MIPHTQLNKHDPENNIYGDCYRTAIACILRVNVEAIPHFYDGVKSSDQVHFETNEFLRAKYGVVVVEIPFSETKAVEPSRDMELILNTFTSQSYDHVYHLFSGMSANGCNHVVVCHRGKIVHDPSTDNSGIVGPCDDGFYWVGLLVRA